MARLLAWTMLASLAVFAFSGAMMRQKQRVRERSFMFLAASPEQGRAVFRSKGCIRCHSVNGEGGKIGPDLGRRSSVPPSLPKLITGMWNHAPTMWERMRTEHVVYPTLDYEEVAQLLTYFYMARHADRPGDASHGQTILAAKGCMQCHSAAGRGDGNAPDLKTADLHGPMEWNAAMWNHAPRMLQAVKQQKVTWPHFDGQEIRDLHAYTDAASTTAPLGDPERGWRTFQQHSCAGCHSIRSAYQLKGPNLGPEQPLPETFSDLGAVMLTHFPQMDEAMTERGISQPSLSSQEMNDIFAFLYSLRYVEPSGSPQVGASVFVWRGCSRCHGEDAEGTSRAPSLRGHVYNSVTLAVSLWHHGQQMYAETRKLGYGWPTLAEEDIGDLLAFLNLPPSEH